jgi:hypothetical protein
MSAWSDRDQSKAAIAAQRERCAVAERDNRQAARRGEREQAELRNHHVEIGEGREPDPDLEAKLAAAVVEARKGLEPTVSQVLYGDGLSDVVTGWTDPLAEARLEGRRVELERLQQLHRAWIVEHLEELAAERFAWSQEIAANLSEARAAYMAAGNAWEREKQEWSGLLVEGGLDTMIADVPETPVTMDLPEVVGSPFPERFAPITT